MTAATTACFRVPARWQRLALLLAVLPFWTSYVVRSYAWLLVLGQKPLVGLEVVHHIGGPRHRGHGPLHRGHEPIDQRSAKAFDARAVDAPQGEQADQCQNQKTDQHPAQRAVELFWIGRVAGHGCLI